MKTKEIEAISKMYSREKNARKEAEKILEAKSLALFEMNKQLATLNNNLEAEINIRIDEINKQEERYKDILESVSDIIYKIDERGYFTYLNPLAAEVSGYSIEELLDMKFINLVAQQDKYRVLRFYNIQYKYEQKDSYIEFRINTKDGQEKWIGQSLQMTFHDELKGFECTGVIREISETKKIQEELEAAKDNALNSARSKEIFLANMSHEIRTPMNAIVGMTNLLAESGLTEKQNKYIQAIQVSTKNLLVIINDILDISKIESGKLEIESINFNLYELMNNTKKSLELKAEENDNVFAIHIEKGTPQILKCDPVRLNQILLNLAGNALKFTKNGTVKLVCSLIAKTTKEATIKIEVIDSGIGIESSKLEKIFESFSQEDESTTRNFGGTGLGLTISKQLVNLLGGDLKVESKVNKGSNFHFTLTLPIGKVTKTKKNDIPKFKNNPLKNKSILLVEDNEINQFLATSVLNKWDVNVDIAENGKIAIKKAQKTDYDIILMDSQMPVMGGIESTHYLRNELKLKTPIIALTANAVKGDKERFLAAGMNDYIPKPFDQNELFHKLVNFLIP